MSKIKKQIPIKLEQLKELRKKLPRAPVRVSRTLAFIGYFTAIVIAFDELTDFWPSWEFEKKELLVSIEDKTQAADNIFGQLATELKISGELKVVKLDNPKSPEVLFSKTYGDVKKDQYYTVASVSKTITAIAFLLLSKDRTSKYFLDLNTSACQYIKLYCGPRFEAIRIIDLLQQRSGLPTLPSSPTKFIRHIGGALFPYALSTWEDVFPENIKTSPRSQFLYSNYNYLVLSRILELHMNKDFQDAVVTAYRNADIELNKETTSFEELHRKRVSGHTHFSIFGFSMGLPIGWIGLGHDASYGAGDMIFSPSDLANLFHQIVHKKPELIEDFEKFTSDRYSTGLVADVGADDRKIFWHNGRSPGYRSFIMIDPTQKIFVVWMANAWMNQKQQRVLGRSLEDIFLEESFEVVKAE